MQLKRMEEEATDRFRGDTKLLCHWTKWFGALHHTMNNERLVVNGNTVCGVPWPWTPFVTHRRRADVMGFVVSEHVLHLERQFASRSKQEGKNW